MNAYPPAGVLPPYPDVSPMNPDFHTNQRHTIHRACQLLGRPIMDAISLAVNQGLIVRGYVNEFRAYFPVNLPVEVPNNCAFNAVTFFTKNGHVSDAGFDCTQVRCGSSNPGGLVPQRAVGGFHGQWLFSN